MKIIYLVSLLLITTCFYGQATYNFNYFIQYEYKRTEDAKSENVYFLTNSVDNSYYVRITESDDDSYYLNFFTESFVAEAQVSKDGFMKAERIKLLCENLIFQKEREFKKRFKFENNPDVLIDHENYKNYSISYRKPRESKQLKKGKSTYIIENGTEFHMPLLDFSRVFDVKVTSEIFPKGIAREMYHKFENELTETYKLVNYSNVNKTIFITDCPQLNP